MRIIILSIVAAILLLSGGLAWFVLQGRAPSGGAGFTASRSGGAAVDSAARIEIELLRTQIEALQEEVRSLGDQVRSLAARPIPQSLPQASDGRAINHGPNAILDEYAQVVLIAQRRALNTELRHASPDFLEEFLGKPRETLSDSCEEMTNPKLRAMLRVQQVGPIRVRMLQPAIDSLERVLENVRAADPDLYARINTAGSLCVRHVRGAPGRVSSHSYGLSVDLNIDGQLDTLGDGRTQLGLTILADFFQAEGWIWGAGFGREDSMHFEVSRDLLEEWRAEGKI